MSGKLTSTDQLLAEQEGRPIPYPASVAAEEARKTHLDRSVDENIEWLRAKYAEHRAGRVGPTMVSVVFETALATLDAARSGPASPGGLDVDGLVALIRIGFLVRYGAEQRRAEPDDVKGERHRPLLMTILGAEDTRSAVAALTEEPTRSDEFDCPLVGCDESFTNDDALTWHMAQVHEQGPEA